MRYDKSYLRSISLLKRKKNYSTKKNNLPATRIVTMNMGMKNSELLKSTNYFNKNFSVAKTKIKE